MSEARRRWKEEALDPTSPEGRAAELLSRVPEPKALTPFQLARIEKALEQPPAVRRASTRLRVVIVAAVLGAPLAFAAVLKAIETVRAPSSPSEPRGARPSSNLLPQSTVAPVPSPGLAEGLDVSKPDPAPDDQEMPVIDLTEGQPSIVRERTRRPNGIRAARALAVPAPSPSKETVTTPSAPPIAEVLDPEKLALLQAESRLIAHAMEQRLRFGDRPAALRSLDEYFRKFPAGQLLPEARKERIHTLLELGRRTDALGELERLAPHELARLPRREELELLKAELLCDVDRTAEALAIFDEAVVASASKGLIERALFGRAGCRERGGDLEGSRADLADYLERFPDGRFSAKARLLLSRP